MLLNKTAGGGDDDNKLASQNLRMFTARYTARKIANRILRLVRRANYGFASGMQKCM